MDKCVRESAVDLEDLKPYWKSEKDHISLGDQQVHFFQIFQTLKITEKYLTEW